MLQRISAIIAALTIAFLISLASTSLAKLSNRSSTTTYSNSKMIGHDGGSIPINNDVKVGIRNGALSDYLDEHQIDAVEITVEMIESYDSEGNLDSLLFTFGPSGAYFLPELELRLKHDYILGTHLLFSEEGEALEYTTQGNENLMTYYIPHFSSYSYDHYD